MRAGRSIEACFPGRVERTSPFVLWYNSLGSSTLNDTVGECGVAIFPHHRQHSAVICHNKACSAALSPGGHPTGALDGAALYKDVDAPCSTAHGRKKPRSPCLMASRGDVGPFWGGWPRPAVKPPSPPYLTAKGRTRPRATLLDSRKPASTLQCLCLMASPWGLLRQRVVPRAVKDLLAACLTAPRRQGQFLLVLDSHVRYIPSAYPCLTAPRAQAHPCGMLDGLAPSKDR